MRKLLIVFTLLVIAASLDSAPGTARASHYSVSISLYHPTGDASNNARLTCGWHTACDGSFNDPLTGLDWLWPSNMSYDVRLRLFSSTSLSSSTVVGSVRTYNTATGCYQVRADVRRTNGTVVERVINQHVQTTTPKTYNILARDQGLQSDTLIGTMVATDMCYSTGRHTMQWYERVDATTSFGKGSGFPNESGCWTSACYQPYAIWNTREYYFSYWHQ